MAGAYTAIRELAVGGMAVVTLARSREGRLVVLKRPIVDAASDRKRLLDEARIGLRIKHENVVETLEVTVDRGVPVLVLEYVDGLSMVALRRAGAMSPGLVALIGAHVCRGLHAIHTATDEQGRSLGVLHRDVSPGNVVVGYDGRARVIDLGIARGADNAATRTATGDVRGTLRYLAPELFQEQRQSTKSDLWALGVVLIEALLGRPIYQGGTGEIVAKILASSPYERERVAEIDAALAAALEPLLRPSPQQREGDAAAAARRFQAVADGHGTTQAALAQAVAQSTPFAAPQDTIAEDDGMSALFDDDATRTQVVASAPTAIAPGRRSPPPAPRQRARVAVAALVGVAASGMLGTAAVAWWSSLDEDVDRDPMIAAARERRVGAENVRAREKAAAEQAAALSASIARARAAEDAAFAELLGGGEDQRVVLVPKAATWRYDDRGVDHGRAWIAPAFDDARWPMGAGPLGYGDDAVRTTLSYGGDPARKHTTVYVRHAFHVRDPRAFAALAIRFARDDGAAVYLNGVEVARSNLAAGARAGDFAPETVWADAGIEVVEGAYHPFAVDPKLLVAGSNVLAAEVHQAAPTSTDLRFDLELVGVMRPPTGRR